MRACGIALLPVRHLGNFNAERADPLFDQKSEAELSGFLNKCIAGALRFQQRGPAGSGGHPPGAESIQIGSRPDVGLFRRALRYRADARWPRSEAYNAWKQYARDL